MHMYTFISSWAFNLQVVKVKLIKCKGQGVV